MARSPLFYIYGRREMVVLVFLGALVAAFAFTLGVHFGKKVGVGLHGAAVPGADVLQPRSATGVETVEDSAPDRIEMREQEQKAKAIAESAVSEVLHDEVVSTGLQLEKPVPTELPDQKPTETVAPEVAEPAPTVKAAEQIPPPSKRVSSPELVAGKFTIQIGSHAEEIQARDQMDQLQALGLKPFLQEADLQGKRWYRVSLGVYDSAKNAKADALKFKNQHLIDSFVVSQISE